jgi:cytochrome c-type biogenesis protein CcmE
MKKSHIFIIIIISVAITIIISTSNDASTYVTFDQAYQMASNGSKNSIHVVGELKKDPKGNIIGIEPGQDKVSFFFIMVDENRKQQIVYHNQPMPQDFTRSEKVVVVGQYSGDVFVAEKILLKCPSKYQELKVNQGA